MQAKSLVIVLGCMLLSACGIKGPLYMPAPAAKGQPEKAAPQTGADDSKRFVTPEDGLPPALRPR
ncbi:MAG: lipoprotein [Proteobacteria bacterium]|nr:lipoprotein [Pseudomonadota bacterium]